MTMVMDKIEEKKEEDVGRQASKVMLDLLRKRWSNQITEEQFQNELTYWSLVECFDNIKYMPLPTPPAEMLEYWGLDVDTRKKVSQDFWKQSAVVKYSAEKSEALDKNRHQIDWLEDLLSKIPESDEVNKEKVELKLIEFKKRYARDLEEIKRLN